jgi:glycosyltransferase involved in cell wall biosynthesis
MASGCIVVGYTGYGGLEYANSQNGFWFSPEQLEEVVDTIATVIEGLARGDRRLMHIREAGMATAARFSRQRTKEALKEVYSSFAKPARSGGSSGQS